MKKWMAGITDFFAFTKSERRGIVALLGILTFLIIGIQLMPYGYSNSFEMRDTDNLLEYAPSNRKKNYREHTDNDTFTKSYNAKPLQRHYNNDASKSFKPIREKKVFTVQANTCDTLDLQQIRGIGSAFSKRIIKYRNQLGGFVRKEQLLEVWGIDSAKYAQIESAFIIDKKNIRKFNINTATINDLKNHPYLDYYQAKAIVQTRDSQGFYESVSDILKIALIDKETFELIKDYLEL